MFLETSMNLLREVILLQISVPNICLLISTLGMLTIGGITAERKCPALKAPRFCFHVFPAEEDLGRYTLDAPTYTQGPTPILINIGAPGLHMRHQLEGESI